MVGQSRKYKTINQIVNEALVNDSRMLVRLVRTRSRFSRTRDDPWSALQVVEWMER